MGVRRRLAHNYKKKKKNLKKKQEKVLIRWVFDEPGGLWDRITLFGLG